MQTRLFSLPGRCRLRDCWCCFECRIGGAGGERGGGAPPPRFGRGNRLAVLLPAPVDAATLVYGNRRPEELVQTVVEQRVVAVVLFGHLTGRRHPSQASFALTVVLAGWHGFSR